ncbi:SGNH/GDSL hydrolase family protein [Cohnella sp. GCM10012308]|uniref:SGNH/GDSL hydrolase family protein n=1 Tax=Cohnella sp. GCM10012308 TaxID=3317329 RepID=UPI00361717C9
MAISLFQRRAGLQRFKRRAEAGLPLAVAFLGGSITEGAGASDGDKASWRALTGEYLAARFGAGRVCLINAGVGGTDSSFGAARLQEHVWSTGPIDLLFVEFAVNDGEDRAESLRGMEGIVRQARRHAPTADICFVYTAADKNLTPGIPFNIAVHEEVAAHYAIPSVNFAAGVRAAIDAAEADWGALAGDLVHPNDEGHALYAGFMRSYLKEALDASLPSSDPPEEGQQSSLPAPLEESNCEFAGMAAPDEADDTRGFSRDTLEGLPLMNWRYDTSHLRALSEDAALSFTVDGWRAGIVLLCGPDTGSFEYSVDGGAFKEVDLFDEWCELAYRPIPFWLPGRERPGRIAVTVRPTGRADPRSKGAGLRILKLLSC